MSEINKLYLILLSDDIDRNKLKRIFTKKENCLWFYNMPNSIFVLTPLNSKQLSMIIRKRFGHVRHFVTEISNYNGILPVNHWKYFRMVDSE